MDAATSPPAAVPGQQQQQPTSARNYGGSWALVRRMLDKGQMRPWTYTPLAGGCLFSLSTILLRGNRKAMLAVQGAIGVGTLAMGNAVATIAIVKERSKR